MPAPARGLFTTRRGGVSAAPWDSADLGLHVGDRVDDVCENRRRLARAAGLPVSRLVFAEQVHGAGVAVVDGEQDAPVAGVDALVTRRPGLGLVVLAADCLPVLLADPVAGVVAAVHAGRAGLAAGVLAAALRAAADLGAQPARMRAVVGPGVCGGCYEVPDALADDVERLVPGTRTLTRQGTAGLDLPAGARSALAAAGLPDVHEVGGCTYEQPELLYSYRRDGRTGRHAGLVWLDPATPDARG
ncbi:MAG: peptidoglycan editing factor PgeF [Actinomycetota bacterium]|nr:peptidoglycan editing factor PgeF [Actinomycetota bacterium]